MNLNEILESERADLPNLKRLMDKYPNDGEVQRIVAQLYAEKTERINRINELLNYRDKECETCST